jgi:hypothetical protein
MSIKTQCNSFTHLLEWAMLKTKTKPTNVDKGYRATESIAIGSVKYRASWKTNIVVFVLS